MWYFSRNCALLLALLLWHHGVRAQTTVQRCVASNGGAVFTDRTCAELQATERAAPPTPVNSARVLVRSCARSHDDLLWGVRSALEAQDVNRLASFYHWSGLGMHEANQLMDRLGTFSQRPLVDVRLVSSTESDPGSQPITAPANAAAEQQLGPATVAATAPLHAQPDFLLRVDQMRSDKDAGAQITYFRLQLNAGCWWIRY